MQTTQALFPLGQIMASDDVYAHHTQMDINLGLLLRRHVLGDWGQVSDTIRYQNNRTLRGHGMFISLYPCQHHFIKIVTTQKSTAISVVEDIAADNEE